MYSKLIHTVDMSRVFEGGLRRARCLSVHTWAVTVTGAPGTFPRLQRARFIVRQQTRTCGRASSPCRPGPRASWPARAGFGGAVPRRLEV